MGGQDLSAARSGQLRAVGGCGAYPHAVFCVGRPSCGLGAGAAVAGGHHGAQKGRSLPGVPWQA